MKTIAVVGLLGILLVPALVMSATRVAIGTGPWSGVYFPVGEALAKVLNKHVPEILWTLPREYFLAYLEGYLRGDGYVTQEGKLSATADAAKGQGAAGSEANLG